MNKQKLTLTGAMDSTIECPAILMVQHPRLRLRSMTKIFPG